jgi:hypothetical protein
LVSSRESRRRVRLFSFGHDGVAGGVGIDSDLDGTEPEDAPHLAPTLFQFVSRAPIGQTLVLPGLAGLLTIGLCIANTQPGPGGQPLPRTTHAGNVLAVVLSLLLIGSFFWILSGVLG